MTSNSASATRTCIAGVVVTNESNMASYFPEAGNLNVRNADICSDVAGLSSGCSDDCMSFQIGQVTTGRHLGFERDCISHTHAFQSVLRQYA